MKTILAFLLLPVTVFATLTVTDRGTGSDIGGGSSIVISPTSGPLAVGSTGCIVIAMDNAGGASINTSATSYTDSQGNIWYVRFDTSAGGASSVAEPVILTSILTHTWTTTDSLTISLANATPVKTWTISEVKSDGAPAKIALDHYMTGTNLTSAPAATTVAITTIYPALGDAIIGWGMAEWNTTWTASTDSTDGTFSTAQTIGAGAASALGISVITQSKVATDTATAQYNLTFGATADIRAGYTLFTETDVRARTVGSNNSNELASPGTVVTFMRPMLAGSAAVMCIAADNGQTNGGPGLNLTTTPITDTRGNSWVKYADVVWDPAAANAGAEVSFYVSILGTAIQVNDTMTLVWSATTAAKCWGVWEFAPTGVGPMSVSNSGTGTASNTASPNVSTGSTVPVNDYVIGLVGIENTATVNDKIAPDTSSTGGTWSTPLTATRGTGLTGMAMTTQWKKVTSAGTISYSPVISGGAADAVINYVQINDASPTGPTAAQKSAFFLLFP